MSVGALEAIEGILGRGGDADDVLRQVVAALVSEHVLLGWDTGGETWEP